MSFHAEDNDYTRLLEMRADWEQAAENERQRFMSEHPNYDRCPKHPDRLVVDSNVCTKRYCSECIEDHLRNYADAPQRDTGSDYTLVGDNLHYCGQYVGPMTKEAK